jgi:hypothetical protein
LLFSSLTLRPSVGHGLLILEISGLHKMTQHNRQDFSGRVISPTQRPISEKKKNNTHSRQILCPRQDSNLQFQQASGMRTYALDRVDTGTGHASNTFSGIGGATTEELDRCML